MMMRPDVYFFKRNRVIPIAHPVLNGSGKINANDTSSVSLLNTTSEIIRIEIERETRTDTNRGGIINNSPEIVRRVFEIGQFARKRQTRSTRRARLDCIVYTYRRETDIEIAATCALAYLTQRNSDVRFTDNSLLSRAVCSARRAGPQMPVAFCSGGQTTSRTRVSVFRPARLLRRSRRVQCIQTGPGNHGAARPVRIIRRRPRLPHRCALATPLRLETRIRGPKRLRHPRARATRRDVRRNRKPVRWGLGSRHDVQHFSRDGKINPQTAVLSGILFKSRDSAVRTTRCGPVRGSSLPATTYTPTVPQSNRLDAFAYRALTFDGVYSAR